jgi:capsular exopolysaccharide synthesis family protein
LPLSYLWGIVRRHWVLISLSGMVVLGLATAYSFASTPVYEGVATLRIDDKQDNVPDVLRPLGIEGGVVTELEVLRSRSLVEAAVLRLHLQVLLEEPEGVSRAILLRDITVSDTVHPGLYRLTKSSNGHFDLTDTLEHVLQRSVAPGSVVEVAGIGFVLDSTSAEYGQITLQVRSLAQTVAELRENITVEQPNRDAKVATLTFRSADRELAWQLPNAIADRFIARRQSQQKSTARSTVAFLRHQLDTLERQLGTAELALQEFRQREQVVNPEAEGTGQVQRLIEIQAERSRVESERAALASLLAETQAEAERSEGRASPYRRLLAFPTLLRNQALTQLITNLWQVEGERSELAVRRTEQDLDLQALDTRVKELESQIHAVASTYLQGLTATVKSMDVSIGGFERQLSRVPKRELDYVRLQRQPKVLEEMYALLQTRLKEAEIAQAIDDPSVQLVDRATRPLQPVGAPRGLIIGAGLVFGLLIGVGLAFLIEYFDKSVHSRTDVMDATGLPVLGLIPRIPRNGNHVALISRRKASQQNGQVPDRAARRTHDSAASRKPLYTFLPVVDLNDRAVEVPSVAPASPVPANVQRMIITGVGTAFAEAYGSLQTNLLHSRIDQQVRAVVFTSAQPGEGKSTTVVNLALSLTHRGSSVLLIDSDLRRGTVHHVFDVPRGPGLSDVLRGAIPFEQARGQVQVEQGGTLHYLTTGSLPPNPSAMLASADLRVFLEYLRQQYELIILDSPPVNMMTDAAILGAIVDGVVIVARAGVTQSAALGYAMEQLSHVRVPVLGVVLNDIDFRRDVTYDPAYRYYDQHRYSTVTS